MKRLSKEFIKELLNKVNLIYKCYYEEPPKDVKFPYCIIPNIVISSLESGDLCIFDIELYTNELKGGISIEDMCDNLRKGLDRSIVKGINFNSHIGFENQNIVKSNDQDLISRRISFSARIFYR